MAYLAAGSRDDAVHRPARLLWARRCKTIFYIPPFIFVTVRGQHPDVNGKRSIQSRAKCGTFAGDDVRLNVVLNSVIRDSKIYENNQK